MAKLLVGGERLVQDGIELLLEREQLLHQRPLLLHIRDERGAHALDIGAEGGAEARQRVDEGVEGVHVLEVVDAVEVHQAVEALLDDRVDVRREQRLERRLQQRLARRDVQVVRHARLLVGEARPHVLQVGGDVHHLEVARRLRRVVLARRAEEGRLEQLDVHPEVVQHPEERVQQHALHLVAGSLALDEPEEALHRLTRPPAGGSGASEDLQPHLPQRLLVGRL